MHRLRCLSARVNAEDLEATRERLEDLEAKIASLDENLSANEQRETQ